MAQLSDFTKGQTTFLNKGKLSNYGKSKTSYTQTVKDPVKKVMKQQGDLAIKELQQNLDRDNSNASFNLRQSIRPLGIKLSGNKTTYLFEIASYYYYVDQGRGKRNSSTPGNPPLRVRIREWLDEKAIGQVKDRDRMAYFIARKINRTGTKGNKFFSTVFDQEFTDNLTRELSIALKTEVIAQIVDV